MTFYNEKGFKRFINSIFFSIAGFKATWKHEEAFRQEVIVFIIAIPLAFLLGNSPVETILLVASVGLVLIVEMINSAIEAVVDRVGLEYHELSGRAKDIGSAAVMLSMALSVLTWLVILLN